MALGGAVGGVVDLIHNLHDRQQASDVQDAMGNYLTDPTGTIKNVMAIDSDSGLKLAANYAASQKASQDALTAAQGQHADHLGLVTKYLRGLSPNGDGNDANGQPVDYGSHIDGLAPFLKDGLGMTDDDISGAKTAIAANPGIIDSMDDAVDKERAKSRFATQVAAPGDHVLRNGKLIDSVPYSTKALTVKRGDGGYDVVPFDPNNPGAGAGYAPSAGGGGGMSGGTPMTVAALRPHFVAQESGGDYTATNKTTGAMGAYQVMPATGAAVAKKLGLPWRSDMMTKSDPASMRYQDAIGGQGIQDAIDNSGGDPTTAFKYYYAGPDQSGWGPKTRKYAADMNARTGNTPAVAAAAAPVPVQGGASAPAGGPLHSVYSTAGAPPKAPTAAAQQWRPATPDELSAYPKGTVGQINTTTGKMQITAKPAAGGKGAHDDQAAFDQAMSSTDDLLSTIQGVKGDPGLRHATGAVGQMEGAIPFIPTHQKALTGQIESINAQKMVALASGLKSSGSSPFSRLTNMEAQQLPKTLGNFSLNQPYDDLVTNLDTGTKRTQAFRQRLIAGAQRNGLDVSKYVPQAVTRMAPAAAPNAPKVGFVKGGFRFTGGNPASAQAWEKVQ